MAYMAAKGSIVDSSARCSAASTHHLNAKHTTNTWAIICKTLRRKDASSGQRPVHTILTAAATPPLNVNTFPVGWAAPACQ